MVAVDAAKQRRYDDHDVGLHAVDMGRTEPDDGGTVVRPVTDGPRPVAGRKGRAMRGQTAGEPARWRHPLLVFSLAAVLAAGLVRGEAAPPASWTVPAGAMPVALAVAGHSGRVFLADRSADTVAMLDARTGAILATTAVGHAPVALVVDEAHGRVYTLNACVVTALDLKACRNASSSVSVLDLYSDELLGALGLGSGATALAADDGGRLIVTTYGSDLVQVFDGAGGRLLRTLALTGEPVAPAVDAPLHRLVIGLQNPYGGRSGVGIFDSRTSTVLATVRLGTDVGSVLADARAGRVLVASDGDTYLLDARTGRTLRRIRGGGLPLAVDSRAGHALLGDPDGPRLVATRDGASLGPVRGLGVVAGPVAVDETAGRFYVTTDRGLAVLSSHTGRLERLLALPAVPVAVAVDTAAHRVFLLAPGTPRPTSGDSSPTLLRWLGQALPWLPLPAPSTFGAGSTLTAPDTTRL